MQADVLLEPITADPPCGPDLEYDRDFLALNQAAQGKPEQQFGDTLVPAEEPDWADVRQRAVALFARTKDLRVAVLLTRALTRVDGMPGLASGLKVIGGLLDRYWEQVHPRLDPDDGLDPTMRLNALAPIADANSLLRDVRAIMFSSVAKHARVSMRDVLIALGKLPAGADSAPSAGEIDEVLRAPQNAQAIAAAREALEAVARIRTVLTEHSGDAQGPDLSELAGLLKAITQATGPLAEASGETAEGGDEGRPAISGSSEIRSREDVVRLLDKICEFIERTEPANPAPLLIRRAQRLLTKNFVEIINDLVPDSLSQIQHIAGIRSE
jgi:type VI secretion system protein ImpA